MVIFALDRVFNCETLLMNASKCTLQLNRNRQVQYNSFFGSLNLACDVFLKKNLFVIGLVAIEDVSEESSANAMPLNACA